MTNTSIIRLLKGNSSRAGWLLAGLLLFFPFRGESCTSVIISGRHSADKPQSHFSVFICHRLNPFARFYHHTLFLTKINHFYVLS
jgi:hypothetical protein